MWNQRTVLAMTLGLALWGGACSSETGPSRLPAPQQVAEAPMPGPAPAPIAGTPGPPAPVPPSPPPPPPVPPPPPAAAPTPTASAMYTVTFRSTWSAATHPTDFPNDAHFSQLIGGRHNSSVSFWAPGRLASDGIKDMAERGRTSPLDREVEAAMRDGAAVEVLRGGALERSPGAISFTFEITRSHPFITLVTMVAPSPDWFVGVHDLNLFQNGDWVSSLTIDLDPYDAGTDSGTTYQAPDRETNPRQPVQRITGGPFAVNGVVAPMGTFTFQRR